MPLSFSDLTEAQIGFVARVSADLNKNDDPAVVSVYGDGSCSPNGEKFAATRLGHSWDVCFDFNTGACYRTAVQLPVDWRANFQARRK
jgi:hypothetical protein